MDTELEKLEAEALRLAPGSGLPWRSDFSRAWKKTPR